MKLHVSSAIVGSLVLALSTGCGGAANLGGGGGKKGKEKDGGAPASPTPDPVLSDGTQPGDTKPEGTTPSGGDADANPACAYDFKGTFAGPFGGKGTLHPPAIGDITYDIEGTATVDVALTSGGATLKQVVTISKLETEPSNPFIRSTIDSLIKQGLSSTTEIRFLGKDERAALDAKDASWKTAGCAVPAIKSRKISNARGSATIEATPAVAGLVAPVPELAQLPAELTLGGAQMVVKESSLPNLKTGTQRDVSASITSDHAAETYRVATKATSSDESSPLNAATPTMTFVMTPDGKDVQSFDVEVTFQGTPMKLSLQRK